MFLQWRKRNHCLFVVLPWSPGAWAAPLEVHTGNLCLALDFQKMGKKNQSIKEGPWKRRRLAACKAA